jgi:hypothetical protein
MSSGWVLWTYKENQVKMYKKYGTVLGTFPLWNGKDPDSYQTVGSGSVSNRKAGSRLVSKRKAGSGSGSVSKGSGSTTLTLPLSQLKGLSSEI